MQRMFVASLFERKVLISLHSILHLTQENFYDNSIFTIEVKLMFSLGTTTTRYLDLNLQSKVWSDVTVHELIQSRWRVRSYFCCCRKMGGFIVWTCLNCLLLSFVLDQHRISIFDFQIDFLKSLSNVQYDFSCFFYFSARLWSPIFFTKNWVVDIFVHPILVSADLVAQSSSSNFPSPIVNLAQYLRVTEQKTLRDTFCNHFSICSRFCCSETTNMQQAVVVFIRLQFFLLHVFVLPFFLTTKSTFDLT